MTEKELLNKVLRYSATIQQPHAIKSYLAAKNLYCFYQNDTIWNQVDQLIAKSEIYNQYTFSQIIQAPKFSKNRIEAILNKGIYPAAYSALLQWYQMFGFESIFKNYVEKAAVYNEYLSHQITILLAFDSVFKQLDEQQVYPFIDRLTEFLTSTFGCYARQKSLKYKTQQISNKTLLQECLSQPNFFGHNLIALAWLIRYEETLSIELLNHLKYNLHLQATTPLEDPEDGINQKIFSTCSEGDLDQFIKNLNQLIFSVCKNLHQVTLADALLYLQQRFPEFTTQLNRFAEYQVKLLNI